MSLHYLTLTNLKGNSMKHLLIILSILLLSSPVIGQKSSLEDKEMTSLKGVL